MVIGLNSLGSWMNARSFAPACRASNPCYMHLELAKAISGNRSVLSRGVPEHGQSGLSSGDCQVDMVVYLGSVSLALSWNGLIYANAFPTFYTCRNG